MPGHRNPSWRSDGNSTIARRIRDLPAHAWPGCNGWYLDAGWDLSHLERSAPKIASDRWLPRLNAVEKRCVPLLSLSVPGNLGWIGAWSHSSAPSNPYLPLAWPGYSRDDLAASKPHRCKSSFASQKWQAVVGHDGEEESSVLCPGTVIFGMQWLSLVFGGLRQSHQTTKRLLNWVRVRMMYKLIFAKIYFETIKLVTIYAICISKRLISTPCHLILKGNIPHRCRDKHPFEGVLILVVKYCTISMQKYIIKIYNTSGFKHKLVLGNN